MCYCRDIRAIQPNLSRWLIVHGLKEEWFDRHVLEVSKPRVNNNFLFDLAALLVVIYDMGGRAGYVHHIYFVRQNIRNAIFRFSVFLGIGYTMDGGARAMGSAGARLCDRRPRGRSSCARDVSLHRRVRVRYYRASYVALGRAPV